MSVNVRFTSDTKDWVAGQEEMTAAAEEGREALRQQAREARELERIAKKVFRDTASEADKYNQELDQLNRALRAGKINQDQYNEALYQAEVRMRKAGGEFDDAFGVNALASVSAMTGGLLTMGSAVAAIREGYQAAKEQAEALAGVINESANDLGALGQVGTSAADTASLRNQARQLRATGAVPTLGAGAQAVFTARSTGLEQDLPTFAELGRSRLISDMPQLIRSVDSLVDAFGRQDIQSSQEVISQLIAASAETQVGFEDIATVTAQIGGVVRAAGFTFEEGAAAIAQITDAEGGTERARTRIQAFLRKAEKDGFSQGRDLLGTIDFLQSRVQGGANVNEIFGGDGEAIAGFRGLVNQRQALEATLGSIRQASSGERLNQALANNIADPSLQSQIARTTAEGRREVALELLGARQNQRETIRAELDRIAAQSGLFNERARGFSRAVIDPLASTFLGEDFVLRRQANAIRNENAVRGDAETSKQLQLLEKQFEELQRLNKQIERQGAQVAVPEPEAN